MSFLRLFLLLVVAIYSPQLKAVWHCKGLLGDSDSRLLFSIDPIEDGFWIPKAHEMEAYKKFKAELPIEISNSSRLTEIAERSVNLKKALIIFATSLDVSSSLKMSDSATVVVNQLFKSLFNEGRPKQAAAEEIAKLIRGSEIEVASKFSADDYRLLLATKKLELQADALNKTLEKSWNDRAEADLVYTWLTADRDPKIEAQLWGNPEEAPQSIVASLPASQSDVQGLIYKHRNTPLIKHGEIYRDRFRAALLDFESDSLKTLHEKYDALFKLKDKGAMDKVSNLLSPYLIPVEGETPSEIYFSRSLDTLKRLFGSAHFFQEFLNFQEAYVEACHTILELGKDTQMTLLERRKLSSIAQETLITYSVDLINIGLNYHPPHEYRYRPLLLEMQMLNGRMEREIVPVGMLINFNPSAVPASSLIIKP